MTRRKQNPQIEFSRIFNKQLKNAPREVKIAFRDTLILFLDNPNNPHLRNHSLRKEYSGHKSLDVTEDWRAVYVPKIDKEGNKQILFKFIGTHNQLYKR